MCGENTYIRDNACMALADDKKVIYTIYMNLRIFIASVFTMMLMVSVLSQVGSVQAKNKDNDKDDKRCYEKVTYDKHHKKHEKKICKPISFPMVTPPVSFPKDHDHDRHDSDDKHHDSDDHKSVKNK